MHLLTPILLAFSLGGSTAATAALEAPPVKTTGDAAADTEALFDRAAVQYETSDYLGAVDTYTQAYQLSFSIKDEALRGKVQAAILFNLGRAHSKAYTLEQELGHLRQEIDLLNKYLEQTADLADQRDAEELLLEAEQELKRVELEAYQAEQDRRAQEGPERPVGPPVTDVPAKRGMQAAGYTLLSLGVATGGVAVAGVVLADQAASDYKAGPTRDDRKAAQQRGDNADIMIIAGSAGAGVLVTTGVALVIAGRKRKAGGTRASNKARRSSKSRAAQVLPTGWASPTSSGLGLRGSF